MNTAPSGYANQTYTVEFTVPGSLDGSTLGPDLVVPASNTDPQQMYRPDVLGDLGLIDVDYIVDAQGDHNLGAIGPRFVSVVWIDSPVAGDGGAAIEVVDATDGSPTTQRVIDSLAGLSTYYRDTPFIVPQGSMLRLVGFTNPGPSTIKVRLTIQYIDDLIAAQAAVCACAESSNPEVDNISTGLSVAGLNINNAVGSTNDTVGRFDGATQNIGDRDLADWVIRNDVADETIDGTEFKITLAGVYGVVGYLATTNDGEIEAGVTLDGSPTIDPVMSSLSTLANVRQRLSALGVSDSLNSSFSGFALVTAARAAGANTGVIRFQVSNGAGGAPTDPPLNPGDCAMKIVRLGPLD